MPFWTKINSVLQYKLTVAEALLVFVILSVLVKLVT